MWEKLSSKFPLYVLLPAFFALAVYANAVNNEFTCDDHSSIVHNKCIKEASVSQIFGNDLWCLKGRDATGSYRPPTVLSLALVHSVFGFSPSAMRMLNIDWSSNMTLFYSAVNVTPNSCKARENLWYLYRKAARFDLALEQYSASREIKGLYQDVFLDFEMALSLHGTGIFDEAVKYYRRVQEKGRQDESLTNLLIHAQNRIVPPGLNEVPARM